MAKIVFVSDSPTITTGYGRVGKQISMALHRAGHQIIYLGWGYRGEPHQLPYRIVPCADTVAENYGEDILARIIRETKPDIVFTLCDPWMVRWMTELEERQSVCWLAYFPIDGYPIPPDWHDWIRNADVPIVFSKFAFDLVTPILGREPVFIPHGVDTSTFKPLPNKQELKKRIIGRDDVFVVGCVARNQPRKNIPALIKAFAKFAQHKDDVALYLHMQIRDVGWNLDEIVERFGINDKAYTTSNFSALQGVADHHLNEIYNLFDVFALPTMAEGSI